MEKSWQDTVKSILNEPLQQIINTNKGLTNINYRVISEHYDVIVRIPHTDSTNVVYREHEALAHRLLDKTHLNLNTLYYDPISGMKITRYISDLLTFNEYHGTDRIQRTAKLMRDLHAINKRIGFEFNAIDRYKKYRSLTLNPMVDDALAQKIIQGITNLNRPHILCHNDWVAGNICFTPSHDYLIDYEYAGDNDPFFDVMSFITENTLTDDEKNEFIQAYFKRFPTKIEQELLFNYQQFHNLLWCTWACMMYESRHEAIYLEIAQTKFKAIVQ